MGAGSIGAWVGASLLAAEAADVVLVGRERLRAEVAARGVTVEAMGQAPRRVPASRVRVETEPSALADRDVVLVAVKSAQTAEVGRILAGVVGPEATVVSLQNGLRNADTLRASLPRVLAGIVGFNVVSKDRATYRRTTEGPLMIERSHPPLVAALRRAGLEVKEPADMEAEQWTKLLVNLNNAVSALSGAPTPELLGSPGYRRIIAALVAEGHRVARASGVRPAPLRGVPVHLMPPALRLPTGIVRLVLRRQIAADPEARSSMWEDLVRGRLTEVDHLNGEVVRVAEAAGVDAPLNRRITALVHEAERAGEGPPGLSAETLATRLGLA